jgi:hypothetical protein
MSVDIRRFTERIPIAEQAAQREREAQRHNAECFRVLVTAIAASYRCPRVPWSYVKSVAETEDVEAPEECLFTLPPSRSSSVSARSPPWSSFVSSAKFKNHNGEYVLAQVGFEREVTRKARNRWAVTPPRVDTITIEVCGKNIDKVVDRHSMRDTYLAAPVYKIYKDIFAAQHRLWSTPPWKTALDECVIDVSTVLAECVTHANADSDDDDIY